MVFFIRVIRKERMEIGVVFYVVILVARPDPDRSPAHGSEVVIYFFGGPGQENGQFWMPSGVMVDTDDTIWVADTYNHRLQIFRLVEESK